MVNIKKACILFMASLFHFVVKAQDMATMQPEENKDFLRSEGKIYVVVLIVITILAGLIYYVARLDRKLSKLEKSK